MTTAGRLDRYRVQQLLSELERLAAREREVRQELREILRELLPSQPGLRERFGLKP
jgi:hypothetical protein